MGGHLCYVVQCQKKKKLLLHQHKGGAKRLAMKGRTPTKVRKEAQYTNFMEDAKDLIEKERELLRYHNDKLKGQVTRQQEKLDEIKSSGVESNKLPAAQSQLDTFQGQLEQQKKLITKHEKKIRNHVFGLWEKDQDKASFIKKYTNIIKFYTKKELNATRQKLIDILSYNKKTNTIKSYHFNDDIPTGKELDTHYESMEKTMNDAGITKKIPESNKALKNVKNAIDIVKRLQKEFDIIKEYSKRNDGIEEPKEPKETKKQKKKK